MTHLTTPITPLLVVRIPFCDSFAEATGGRQASAGKSGSPLVGYGPGVRQREWLRYFRQIMVDSLAVFRNANAGHS
jgi:hypothetical protein